MSSVKYKLTYFYQRGRAEPIRVLFAALNIPFEDHRIEFSDWATLKSKIPTHRLPYLEIVGESGETRGYSESMAIARFIAHENNMMGRTSDEYYKIEKIISLSIYKSLKESSGPFVTGDKPSFGDLYLLTVMDHVQEMDYYLSQSPYFAAHREAVLKEFPKLAEYLKTRPVTPI
ncbi:unnamed protein product [Calicophoron daubneyi]|uniref:glutathione transferase n=1 Tax=Calicophoron daubneyi TaxID=300641 RepID=A0AAV2T658_CALDB